MFLMERFYYNTRWSTNDHQTLEDIYDQCYSTYYTSYELKIDKCTMGCTIFIFYDSISDFAEKIHIGILRATTSINTDGNLAL